MAGRWWRRGGILGLLDLIDQHRGALEYDFRARFQVGLSVLPDDMGWDEAVRLVRIIRQDPSSALAAAIEGWPHPVSRTDVILMDLWDLTAAAATSKGKPPVYPRVWKVSGEKTRHGNAAGLDQADVHRRLAAMSGRPI